MSEKTFETNEEVKFIFFIPFEYFSDMFHRKIDYRAENIRQIINKQLTESYCTINILV